MRKENLYMYSGILNKDIEREFEIYKRDEFIKHIQENNIDLSNYYLETHTPKYLNCAIETFKSMDKKDEFFIFEEDKMIYLYLQEEENDEVDEWLERLWFEDDMQFARRS